MDYLRSCNFGGRMFNKCKKERQAHNLSLDHLPEKEDKTYLYLKYALVTCLALACLVAALAVEAYFIKHDEQHAWIREPTTYVSLLHELGFAFIIALVISIGIEAYARSQHNKLVEKQMGDLKRDVLRESLGVVVSKNIFEEVKDLVLLSPFERSGHRSEYDLKVIEHNESKYMLCYVTTYYRVINRTNLSQDFPISCYIDKPAVPDLDGRVRVQSVFVDGKKINENELMNGDQAEPDTVTFKRFKHNILIESGDDADITISYTMVKELNDTEVWKSIYPGDGMTLCVRFPNEVKVLDAHSLHRLPVKKIAEVIEAGSYTWTIDKPILPHQGIVFWWRCYTGCEEIGVEAEGPRSLDGEMAIFVEQGKV